MHVRAPSCWHSGAFAATVSAWMVSPPTTGAESCCFSNPTSGSGFLGRGAGVLAQVAAWAVALGMIGAFFGLRGLKGRCEEA